jgi:hypothetical protein
VKRLSKRLTSPTSQDRTRSGCGTLESAMACGMAVGAATRAHKKKRCLIYLSRNKRCRRGSPAPTHTHSHTNMHQRCFFSFTTPDTETQDGTPRHAAGSQYRAVPEDQWTTCGGPSCAGRDHQCPRASSDPQHLEWELASLCRCLQSLHLVPRARLPLGLLGETG